MPIDTLTWDWRVEAGQDETLVVPQRLSGAPLDITGWGVSVSIYQRPGGSVVYPFPTGQILAIPYDLPEGTGADAVRLTLPRTAIATIAAALHTGWWKMTITSPSDIADRVVNGLFLIDP